MKTLHRFTVFDSYVRVIEHLAKEDLLLAQELSYDIIMYGIYGRTPHMIDTRLLEHWERVVETLDKFRNRSLKRLNHGVDLDFENYNYSKTKLEEVESIEDDYWEGVHAPIGSMPGDEYFTSNLPFEGESR